MKIEILASGSKGNCYKIKNKNTTLLIECGIPIKEIQKKLNYRLTNIDGCLITHEHKDHARSFCDLLRAGVDVYLTNGTNEAIKNDLMAHRAHTIKINEPVIIGTFKILPIKAIHDAAEPCNFMIEDLNNGETLIFATDTQYVPMTFKNLDYAMLEINYTLKSINQNEKLNPKLRARIKKNHMSLETAIDFLEKTYRYRLKKIYVLHLSDYNSDEEEIKEKLEKTFGIPVVIA